MKIISREDKDIFDLIESQSFDQIICNQEDLPELSLSVATFLKDNGEVFVGYVMKKNGVVLTLNAESVKKNELKYDQINKNKKAFYKLLAKDFEEEDTLETAGKKYVIEVFIKDEMKKEKLKTLSEEERGVFEQNDIEFKKLECASYFMSIVSAIIYDDVQYCISFSRHEFYNNKNQVLKDIKRKKEELEWLKSGVSHQIIKDIFTFLKEKTQGDIYAMLGGGSQIQIFFGNECGYLGILYFPVDEEVTEKTRLTLTVNFSNNNELFEELHHKNISVFYSNYESKDYIKNYTI